ncbi:aspartate kinase [Xylariaceae sp. FL0016]|nr:aspartate kinase [Xylariaceae sp. FL0016]
MVSLARRMPWLVQKYGGTSLGKLLDNICGSIISRYAKDHRLVVVCSALSGSVKASGTTSLLLECIVLVELGCDAQTRLVQTMNAVKDFHLNVLDSIRGLRQQRHLGLYDETRSAIAKECERLERFLLAAQVVGELSPRSRDRVISLGEKLASIIVAACLISQGIVAKAVSLENIVASAFGPSIHDQITSMERLGPKIYHILAAEIAVRIRECGAAIPIVTGFFGIMPDSLLQRVGRGYSDMCAAMCAVAVNAIELQIWKEVDGIFTADPRKVSSARLLTTVTAEEAAELTYYGSEVIHPLTMDQIRDANIPLRLKNVFKAYGDGTIIHPVASLTMSAMPMSTDGNERSQSISPLSSFILQNESRGVQQQRRIPTAVTVKDNIILANVICNRNTKSQGFLTRVFDRLERSKVLVDLVTTSERHASLAAQAPADLSAVTRLREELESLGQVGFIANMSIVTVVGHKMRNMVGVSGEILGSLASSQINVYLISQGASELSISLVVCANDAMTALNAIHRDVLKIPSQSEQDNRFMSREPDWGKNDRRADTDEFILGPWLF